MLKFWLILYMLPAVVNWTPLDPLAPYVYLIERSVRIKTPEIHSTQMFYW